MIRLIIARHGNTFSKGETPTRVGARTDLPLVESGFEQATRLGKYLMQENLLPDETYAAPLLRTMQTATGILAAAGLADEKIVQLDTFTEIDYGPDENKTEEEVIARIGQEAIDDWNSVAKVPDGWKVNPDKIIANWKRFADTQVNDGSLNKNVLVVTSNGIARFAPYITGNFQEFISKYDIKMGTGCVSLFHFTGTEWICDFWNVNPKHNLKED